MLALPACFESRDSHAHLVIVTIEVDVDNLWKTQAPFKIYSAEYLQGHGDQIGEFYKGFLIKMKVDPRDLRTFKFAASVLNSNTIVVTAPALDFHDAGGDVEAEDEALELKHDPRGDNDVIWEALTNGRLDFDQRKLEKRVENKVVYHLRFNGGVHLSSEVLYIHSTQRDGRMVVEAINVSVDLPYLGQSEHQRLTRIDEDGDEVFLQDDRGRQVWGVYKYKYFAGSLVWRVADISSGTRKQHTGRRAATMTEGFEAMFGGLNLNRPDAADADADAAETAADG